MTTEQFKETASQKYRRKFKKNVAKEEAQQKIARFDEQWEGLKSITGIQSKHFFQPEETHSISVARTSMSHSKCTLILKSQTTTNTEDDKTESDWTDDDLEPLTNHQLRKEISCPDISVPSVSGQGKTNKLRFSDVYSDSDSEFRSDETPSTSIRASKLSPEACPDSETATLQAAVLPKDICTGLYVLVQLLCKTGKTKTQYRYVGLCQSDMDEDGEVRVQFMTTIDGKRFTEIVGYIADVQFDDIIAKLEAPESKTDGNSVFVEFSTNMMYLKRNK